MTFISAGAYEYLYSFSNTPISDAIVRISRDHPEINISFIYKELDKYRTSAEVGSDDPYEALRQTIGLNPVSVIRKDRNYYIEAFQHGKFTYTGQAIGNDGKPITAATVMLLEPNDSTVLTYGITDDCGYFSIPCDHKGIIAKLTCLGYKPTYKRSESFAIGTVIMAELPIRLRPVNVEADNAILMADKSIYRPTQKQKNASQTATDLLVRMAIPHLDAKLGSSTVTTVSGQPVAIYIDYTPATPDDLRMMRTSDVISIEFFEYPTDPRFMGNKDVINFRMVRYKYGGYVKTLATEKFIANSGFLQSNTRLAKNKMTYDIMAYGSYLNNTHFSTDQTEFLRLPDDNGGVKSFQRESTNESSEYRKYNAETSFRALYSGEHLTTNNHIAFGIDATPHDHNTGFVRYTDDITSRSDYESQAESQAKNLSYNGYYFLSLNHDNSLSADLSYSYSHTNQKSDYNETGISSIYNEANDNTHNANIELNYNQSFSGGHSVQTHLHGLYEHNRTNYHGSINALDNSATWFGQIGSSYSFKNKNISASFGFGWNWLSTRLNTKQTNSNFPFMDASFKYTPNKRNSFNLIFHYSVWPPSSNYKSENIIQVSPVLWHTGNPFLKSYQSYDAGLNYIYVPSKKFNMSVFFNTWFVGNREAFVYKTTPEGIIRTIQQPIGSFGHYNYGISASTNQFDHQLHISGRIEQLFVHNGMPYDFNRSFISYYIQTLYYSGSFNFAIAYQSQKANVGYEPGSGTWIKNKGNFIIQCGWSNSFWNISITAQNLQRWNWRASYQVMNTDNYSVNRYVSNTSSHAFVSLSATYTFGFGKKIRQGDDISRKALPSSGILK